MNIENILLQSMERNMNENVDNLMEKVFHLKRTELNVEAPDEIKENINYGQL